jgi:hypothetical protein
LTHQLKGAGTGFGFPRITELAAGVESDIKTQVAAETIRLGIDELIALIRSTSGYDRNRENPGPQKEENSAPSETAHHR